MRYTIAVFTLIALVMTGSLTTAICESTPAPITEESYMETLTWVTQDFRWTGTAGEQRAAQRIADAFASYGYEQVTLQPFAFTEQEKLRGVQTSNIATNVIATKEASLQDADILIVSAHLDSQISTTGGNDDGTGSALVLELARALAQTPTDTEVRFITFSAEELMLLGSAYYVSTLNEAEKARIIGVIQIDMVGHYRSEAVWQKNAMVHPTLVGNLMNESAQRLGLPPFPLGPEAHSDQFPFNQHQIPGVLLIQNTLGVENHRVTDNLSIVDASKVIPLADVLLDTLRHIMSEETGSLREESRLVSDFANASAAITEDSVIVFDGSKSSNEFVTGSLGEPAESPDDAHVAYQYKLRWFGMDQALPTLYLYACDANGNIGGLKAVEVAYAQAGLSDADMAAALMAAYGQPVDGAWVSEYASRRYTLENGKIQVASQHNPEGRVIRSIDLTQPLAEQGSLSEQEAAALAYVRSLLAGSEPYVQRVEIWSDGHGYITMTAYPDCDLSEDTLLPLQNQRYVVRIDPADLWDSEGFLHDEAAMLLSGTHAMARVLFTNNTQVDLEKIQLGPALLNADGIISGGITDAFYQAFWRDQAYSFHNNPEVYVNMAASVNLSTDLQESFGQFVLSNCPAGDSLAEQKIQFFYRYPEMVEIRDTIRQNIGFPINDFGGAK